MSDRERNNQLLTWTETALGTSLYYDEERRHQVTEQPTAMLDGTLRGAVTSIALREIAKQRLTERRQQDNPLHPQEFSRQWDFTEEAFFRMPDPRQQTLLTAARQVILLNNLEESRQKDREYLRLDQKGLVDDMISSIGKEPNIEVKNPDINVVRGVLLKNPTGTGKTILEETLIEHAKIGQPASARDPRPLTAIVAAPSILLAKQFAERHEQTTQSGRKISIRFGQTKQAPGELHITTISSLKRDTEVGAIKPTDIDMLIVDEGHHLLGHFTKRALMRGAFGNTILAFTATAKYNAARDLSKILTYTHEGASLVSYMRQGILNGGQFFVFRVDLDREKVEALADKNPARLNELLRRERRKHVIEAARQSVRDGLPVSIYCEPGKGEDGKPSIHARTLAQELMESGSIITEDGRTINIVAKAIVGKITKPSNQEALSEFATGAVHVVTSVSALGEGWDANVGAVIWDVNTYSRLLKEQQMGRGARFNKKQPLTRYMDFVTATFGKDSKQLVSVWDIIGLDEVEQGHVITSGNNTRRASTASRPKSTPPVFPFTGELAELLIESDKKLVSAVTFSLPQYENVLVPAEYKSLEYLRTIDTNYTSDSQLRAALKRGELEQLGKWVTSNGRRTLEYYYPPEAEDYIREHPAPSLEAKECHTLQQASDELEVSREFIKRQVDDPDSPVAFANIKNAGKKTQLLDETAMAALREAIRKIPEASRYHVRVAVLASEISGLYPTLDREHISQSYMRYRNEETGRFHFGYFVTQEDADKLWVKRHAYDFADDHEVPFKDVVAALRGKTPSMTDTQAAAATSKITTNSAHQKASGHYPIEIAHQLVEQNRKEKIPIDRVALTTLQILFNRPNDTIRRLLEKHVNKDEGGPVMDILSLHSTTGSECYSWNVLPILIASYGQPRVAVDPNNLPRNAQDSDLSRIEQAHSIQKLEGRIQAMAEGILSHANGRPEKDPEILRGEVLPKVIPRKNIEISKVKRTYSPNHPETMDIEAIHDFTGVPVSELQEFFEHTTFAGSLPPEPRVNEKGRITLHHRGRGLKVALMTLMGVSATYMAAARNLPVALVEKFLQEEITEKPSESGGYSFAAWLEFTKAFRPLPQGWRPLTAVPVEKEELKDPVALLAFIHENGGTSDKIFNNKGQKITILSPLSVYLVASQTRVRTPAPMDCYNREEIAQKAFRTPKEFDEWLHQRPGVKDKMVWAITRTKEKVLPHFNYKSVESFIREGYNAHQRKMRSEA